MVEPKSSPVDRRRPLGAAGLYPVLLLSLTACVPAPRTVQVFPAITGVVLQAGQPVAGARISAASEAGERGCADAEPGAVTDRAGRFVLAPDRDLRWFLSLGDPLSSWIVCIEHEGVHYLGWHSRSLGYAPRAVEMECDLDAPIVERGTGAGVCRTIAVPSSIRRK